MSKETATGTVNVIGTVLLSYGIGSHFGAWLGLTIAGTITLLFGVFGGNE